MFNYTPLLKKPLQIRCFPPFFSYGILASDKILTFHFVYSSSDEKNL